jgi:hypothetical protein
VTETDIGAYWIWPVLSIGPETVYIEESLLGFFRVSK